ncbi:MAG: RluA family pseudouridine synthase [Alphaproteobacteria bacterium]
MSTSRPMGDNADPSAEQRRTVTVAAADSGRRLDQVLAAALAPLSRSRLKNLILDGHVVSGGATIMDASQRVKPGQVIDVRIPPAVAPEPKGQHIDLNIVYEDAHLVVIDKPAGMVVHPAAGNPDGTLVNALIAHCGGSLSGIGGVARPGIVHRIDKDTSGLLVVAKTDAAHQGLAAQFARHDLDRAYIALAWGVLRPASGTIEGAIGRSAANRKKMAVVHKGGKAARTDYRVLKRFGDALSLVECRLSTGRTHQIRVHLASRGHPLVGDPVYGGTQKSKAKALPPSIANRVLDFKRQALHAFRLGFKHPISGKTLSFESDLPSDLRELIYHLELL